MKITTIRRARRISICSRNRLTRFETDSCVMEGEVNFVLPLLGNIFLCNGFMQIFVLEVLNNHHALDFLDFRVTSGLFPLLHTAGSAAGKRVPHVGCF